jgi:hypothetical protein
MNTNPNFSNTALGAFDMGFTPEDTVAIQAMTREKTEMPQEQYTVPSPIEQSTPAEVAAPAIDGLAEYRNRQDRLAREEYDRYLTNHLAYYTGSVAALRQYAMHPEAEAMSAQYQQEAA